MADIVYDFEGHVAGVTVTTSTEDFDAITGGGTAVYASGGLVTGSTAHIRVQGERRFRVNLIGLPVPFEQVGAAVRHDSTPSANFALSTFYDAGDVPVGALFMKTSGRYSLADETGAFVADSADTYLGSVVHFWSHHLDHDGNFQVARLYNADGDFLEQIVGPIGSNAFTYHQSGIATTSVTHDMHMGPMTLSNGTWAPPNEAYVFKTYNFQGYSEGDNVNVARTGADAVNGAGTMTFTTPGLDAGSTYCARVTGQRFLYTDAATVGPYSRTLYTLWEVLFTVNPTSNIDLLRLENSSSTNQCKVQLKDDGRVRVLFGSEFESSSGPIVDGEMHYLLHKIDSDAGWNELTIYDKNGAEIQTFGAICGTDVVGKHKIGSVDGPAGYIFKQDNVIISADRIEPPTSPGLSSRILGAVTDRTAVVAIKAAGAETARLVLDGDAVTDFVTLDADGRGFIPVELVPSVSAGQTVQLRIETSPNPDGSASVDVGFADIPFAKSPGQIGTTIILAEGCLASTPIGDTTAEAAFLEARSFRGTPTVMVNLGDEGYANPQNDWSVDEHIEMYDFVRTNHPNLRLAQSTHAVIHKFSDHDRLEGNNVYHGDGILTSVEAWEQYWPHHEIVGRPVECSYEEHVDGRVILISPDDRSNLRDDPTAAEGPGKTFLGTWQHARVKAILDALPDENDPSDTSDIQAAVIFTDMLMIGEDNAFVALDKKDAIANYSWARADLLASAAGKRVVWISGDTHHLIMDEGSHNAAGIMTMSCAGMLRMTGNLNKFYTGLDADYFYPPFDEGLGRFPEVETNTYGIITIVDTGPSITITLTGREHISDTTHEISRSWAAYDPFSTEPPGAALDDFVFDLGGVPFGLGRSIEVETFSPGPATWRVQDAEIPHQDGVMFGRDYLTPGTWSWELYTNTDTYEDALVSGNELADVWINNSSRNTPGEVVPLRYQLGGVAKRVYGRPRRFALSVNNADGFLTGKMPIDVDFALADHLVYSDTESIVELDVYISTVGGLVAPLVEPLTTLVTEGPREGAFTVDTATDTWAIATFFGPITDPFITVNGWRLQIRGSVAYDETLVVDPRPWKRSAMIGDTPAGHMLDKSTRLDQMTLSNGEHELEFGGSDQSGDARVRLSWRSTLIGL